MLSAILLGGLIGYMFGRGSGMLLGAAIGLAFALWRQRVLQHGLGTIRSRFLDSTFAIMGAMCKADGQVTGDEIRAAERVFDRLHLSGEQREAAKAAFNRGKSPEFDLDAEAAALGRLAHRNRALLQLFLQVQLWAIAADGVLHEQERTLLLRVVRAVGLPDAEVERLEALLHGAGGPAQPDGQSLDDAYRVLGVDPSASDAEVKKAYRRLMSKHHPDKLAGQGMPESMREVAEERTREIRRAYERVTEARQQA